MYLSECKRPVVNQGKAGLPGAAEFGKPIPTLRYDMTEHGVQESSGNHESCRDIVERITLSIEGAA